ncbi:MAG: FHA domain-containing serine/threonine-protein kinase [Planctomycetota bacterium]
MNPRQLALDAPSLGDHPLSLPMQGNWVIGSDPKRADLVIPDLEVDGVHCVLRIHKDGTVQVADMGSKAGIRIDGHGVSQAELRVGQRLDVASVSLWLIDELEAPARGGLPTVPGYELERELGRGEFGTVYLAVQQSLQRKVALKVLSRSQAAREDAARQFLHEARTAASLAHAHVVTVFDVGQAGDLYYLSMEYMAGGSWADRVHARGPIPWGQVLRILSDTASALEYAETRHLVHRDIKPANLMVTETGATKLADLGLVLSVAPGSSDDHGPLVGTPHFLAPELVRGGAPNAQSDLYALGASAYQLLTGETPFQGKDSKEILRAALRQDPTPLIEKVPDVPPALADLVHGLLAKDPSARPPGAKALHDQVALLQRELGHSHWPVEHHAPYGKGAPVWAWGLAIALFGGIGGYAWWSRRSHEPKPAPPQHTTVVATQDEGPKTISSAVLDFESTPETEPGTGPAIDLDQGAQFEQDARDALARLSEQDLQGSERVQALRSLAGQFQGSSVADEALAQATAIEEAARALREAQNAQSAAVAVESERLAQESAFSPDTGNPLTALEAVQAFAPLLPGEQLGDFVAVRRNRQVAILRAGERWLRDKIEGSKAQRSAGQFDAVAADLEEAIARYSPLRTWNVEGSLEPDSPAQVRMELLAHLTEMDGILAGLTTERHDWNRKLEREDRQTFQRLLGAGSGLRAELQNLDLERARVRLQQAQDSMGTAKGRDWVRLLQEDIAAVFRVRDALIAGWPGEWKRQNTLDPRESRPIQATVTGLSADWVSLGGERVPWSAFVAEPERLLYLFDDRLNRPWNAEETRGRVALEHLAAALRFLSETDEMFDSAGGARFTEGEQNAALAIWTQASPAALASPRWQAETRTAQAMLQGLDALSADRYGAAAGFLDRARKEGSGTWIITLLTDGSSLEFAPSSTVSSAPAAPEAAVGIGSGESER